MRHRAYNYIVCEIVKCAVQALLICRFSFRASAGSKLVLGVLYMLGARSRAKIECSKMHIRAKVRTFIEIWIFYS